jgi:folate-dependent phosphoribosylglycinamide formyltransferase PurN
MKLALFGSSSSFITSIIYKELCNILKYRKDIELVAVIDCDKSNLKHRFMKQDLLTTISRYLVFKIFSKHKVSLNYFGVIKGKRVNDINSPEFIQWLKSKRVDAILSVSCIQKFGKELVDNFYCVNYHNSLLPKYRGLYSMSWSVYFKEEKTGFTFHRITTNWDNGNIIYQRILPINRSQNYHDIIKDEVAKTKIASYRLEYILSSIMIKSNGDPQTGKSSYYGQKELDALPKNKWSVICFGWNKAPEEFVPKWILNIIK